MFFENNFYLLTLFFINNLFLNYYFFEVIVNDSYVVIKSANNLIADKYVVYNYNK